MVTLEVNRRRRKWPWVMGSLLGLSVVVYCVATSEAFVRRAILPRIGAAWNTELTAEEVSFKPFSALILRKVKIVPRNAEPLAAIQEIRLRYSMWSILRGTIKVTEAAIETPVVTVVGHPDGSNNLSRLVQWLPAQTEGAPAPPSGRSSRLEVRNVALRNGTIRYSSAADGAAQLEIANLNVALDQLVNGAAGKLTIGYSAQLTSRTTNQVAAKAEGAFGFELDEKLLPNRINGALDVGVTSAAGAFRRLGQVAVKLSADATAHAIRDWRLALSDSGHIVGELVVHGPFDPGKQEMQLDYELRGVEQTAFEIGGALIGVDFGQASAKAKGRITASQAGQSISSLGTFSLDGLSVKSGSAVTPVLDSSLEYQLQIDWQQKTVQIDKADLSVRQGGSPVIKGELDQPMNLAWGRSAAGFQPATYSLSVRQFDLAPWRAFTGTNLISGRLNLEGSFATDRDGRRLSFAVGGTLDQLGGRVAHKVIRDVSVSLDAGGSVTDLRLFTLDQAKGEVRQAGQSIAVYDALGHWDQRRTDLGGKVNVYVQLPPALQMCSVSGVELTSGSAQVRSQVTTKAGQTNVSISATLAGVNGKVFATPVRDYQAVLEAAGSIAGTRVDLNPAVLTLRTGLTPSGGFNLTGDFDRAAERGKFDLKLDLGATAKASNRLQAVGQFDLGTQGGAPSSLNLNSDALDLTPLYNLFSGSRSNQPPATASTPESEPAQTPRLPVQDFTFEGKIAKFFLREIAISNWITKAVLNRSSVTVSPFSLTLNGAPVAGSANFDLGVPGYRYDLNADLQSVPVKPLAQSVLHGQLVDLQGTMSGQMKFTGIGATGADLREHLRGTMSFAATNLDHRVTGTQQPWIQALFGTLVSVLRLPNISQSPIDGIATELQAGQGVLNVKSARINSAACIIEAQGQMRFADILTNSPINFPIRVSIPKSGRFESLPQFLTLGGTLTAPQPELNPLGVAQLATQLPGSAGGLVNQGVGQLGGILDKALGQAGATNLGVGTSLLKGFLDGARTNGASNANSTRPASDQKKSNP